MIRCVNGYIEYDYAAIDSAIRGIMEARAMSAEDQTVNDRPGPSMTCPSVIGTRRHGTVPTFIGMHYLLTNEWEAVCCTLCQRALRWATDAESVINAALRADGQSPPELP